ncbi:DUF6059 family protein [Streptomyces massasporeus]|uniref:DUF6059 family protein n=1 Tax=Streptomyces massasporeus TaxID=67324 RepID=UPI0038066157
MARAIFRSLVAAGAIWVYIPLPEEPGRERAPEQTRALIKPPPGHPERLRPDIPLSAVERNLARSLSHPEDTE